MGSDGGMQALGWLPRAITHTGDALAVDASGMERDAVTVGGEDEAVARESAGLDLQALHRAVDVADRAARARLLAQHVPRFERRTQFDVDVANIELAHPREAELEVRIEPARLEWLSGHAQVAQHVVEVRAVEMRQ